MKHIAIAALLLFAVVSSAADEPAAQPHDIIIENGYVAEPAPTNPQNEQKEGDEDFKTYHDPYQYDYDGMGGKYNGGARAGGGHGGGGGGHGR